MSPAPDREDVEFYGEYLEVDAADELPVDVHVRRRGLRPAGRPGDPHLRGPRRPDEGPSVGHFGSPEAIEGALATGMAKGAIETWDRLETVLAEG